MKINWKVRLQNGPFLMGVASAVIMFVFYMLDMFGVVTSVTAEQIMQGVQLLLLIPAAIGIISDPTTKGVNDSARALTYTEPKVDNTIKNPNAKRLFISQPMRGKTDEEILAVREKALKEAKEFLGDNVELIDSFFDDHGKFTPLECLGKSVELMSQADVVYFADGWKDARGCQIERMCAAGYGKDLIDETAIE